MSSFFTCKKSQSFLWTKFKLAVKRHVEVVLLELFVLYFNVIPHIFNAIFSSESIISF